ncbi:hypothetical protein NM208_g4630 [Fusarium decemcellulare]|uniref:Uncharacterized protein n=1 Tax=Fusarium decemcellulare TaxID=57161 RepID=A0ACC1SK77_9HYPO|nr:hypothetical protein NM208_g4630 [Fusarium decemcellulare]
MKLNLEGKVVLVSGGSSGIGKAIATDFAREGASVMITARRVGPLQDAVTELEALGGRASYFAADMTLESDVVAAVARTKDVFGIIPEVVVCNVRSLIKFGFDDTMTEDFRTSSEQCVLSVVHLAKAVLPTWKKTQWGRFINLGSVCTLEPHRWHHTILGNTFRLSVTLSSGQVGVINTDYISINNRAAVGLMRSLSNEFSSYGITFNTIAIGLIDTGTSEKIINDADKESRVQAEPQPQISMKRPGRPEEVAAQVVFLASDRASYVKIIHIILIFNYVLTSLKVTGQNIVVDGGWTRGI